MRHDPSDPVAVLLAAATRKKKRRPPLGPWTLDGAPRKPIIGNGLPWLPLLPIFKHRAPRRWN